MLRQPRWRSLWQSSMTTGYDATNPRSVLRHAWNTWSWWRFMHGGPKAYQQFHASASTLARRALRGWRRWTIRTRLFVPSWQRCRIQPHWLPPLPASEPLARRRPQITSLPYLAYGRKFWKGKSGSQQELAAAATGTIPRNCNGSGAARSGRQPILLVSRSPTSSLPIGRGFGHGRAARPRRSMEHSVL